MVADGGRHVLLASQGEVGGFSEDFLPVGHGWSVAVVVVVS